MALTRKEFLKGLGTVAAVGGLSGGLPSNLLRAAAPAPAPAQPTGIKRTKITSVEVFPYSLPMSMSVKIALAAPVSADNVLVRLRTADGLVGWGESSPYSGVMSETQASDLALAKSLGPLLKGKDPFTLPQLLGTMVAYSPGSPGITAAFEMALWDLCGKIAGQPIHRLLGTVRESFETDQTMYLDPIDETVSRAKDAVLKQGYKVLKLKIGESPEKDIARVRAVREAVGPHIELRVDANQGWSVPDSIRALRGLEPFNIQHCEQPVPYWDWAGMKQVRSHSPIAIMADESVHKPQDAITAIRLEAADAINIKLMKSGGILQGVRIAQVCAAANMECMVGCMMDSRIALTAAAHLVMSQPNILHADLDGFLSLAMDPVIGGMQCAKGTVTLPDAPGLGLDIDPAFLKKLQPITL